LRIRPKRKEAGSHGRTWPGGKGKLIAPSDVGPGSVSSEGATFERNGGRGGFDAWADDIEITGIKSVAHQWLVDQPHCL